MNNTMTIYCRLIDGKRMLDDLQNAYACTARIHDGIPAIGMRIDAPRVAGEAAQRIALIIELYMSAMITMIYATGTTNERLRNEDLFDFLQGYTGEAGKGSESSKQEALIRKMGSNARKQHDEIIKKEQSK